MSENTSESERKMQTPRQILNEYIDFEDVNATETVELLPLTIVDAMIEYANQYNIDTIANVSEDAGREKSDLMRWLGGRRKIGTPNNVNVLLHCYYSSEPHPRRDAPAVKECLDTFLEEGVIERDTESEKNIFRTTALGDAWVEAICKTQKPKQVFLDEGGAIL
jgi:hypothetical protein